MGRNENLTVGVLMGGTSSEREVSLRSGQAVAEALRVRGHRVRAIEISSETGRELDGVPMDVAFLALHGRFGEDGKIQRLLEARRVPYTGSGPDASRVAMDKIESKRLFKENGLETPPHRVIARGDAAPLLEQCARALGYPIVVKPRSEGSSHGVSLHEDRGSLLDGTAECFRYEDIALMEKYIAGKELTVGILDGDPLPIIEMRPKRRFFDTDAKYSDPGTKYVVDPPLSDIEKRRVQRAAKQAHQALGCEGFSRVDVILTPFCGVHILEVNTIPGLTERSLLPKAARAAGLVFPDLCQKIVDTAFRRRRDAFWAAAAMF